MPPETVEAAPPPSPEPSAAPPGPDIEAVIAAVAASAPAPEPPAEAAPPAPAEPVEAPPAPSEPATDDRVRQLVEQERALHAERRRIQEEQAAARAQQETFLSEKAELEKLAKYRELHAMAEERDVLGALEQMGFTPEEVGDAIVNARGVRPGNQKHTKLEQEIQALKDQFAARDKAAQEAEQEALVRTAKAEALTQIQTSPLLTAFGADAADAVLDAFQSHYKQTGVSLTYPEAIQRVETQISDMLKSWAQHDAVRKILSENAPPSDPPAEATPASPTLTNQAAASVTQRSTERTAPTYDGGSRLDLIDKIIESRNAVSA